MPFIETDPLIQDLSTSVLKHYGEQTTNLLIVGIRTGGLWLAESLAKTLEARQDVGALDISFYRDDFSRIGINPSVQPSHLPWDIDNQDILLVDDILFTGRTIRAAMHVLFDYGRPNSIKLAVLAERTGRELPIQADFCAMHADLESHQHIKLSGPDPLTLETILS